MKYIRKIVILIIAIVLLASLIIGIGVIFAVKNINVSLLSYSYADGAEEEYSETDAYDAIDHYEDILLKKYRGTLMTFVKEDELAQVVKNSEDDCGKKYVLEKCVKSYPCTLDIVIRERREAFVVQSGEFYNHYDEDGELLRASAEDDLNPIDGAPNVYVSGAQSPADMREVAKICVVFGDKFSALRSVVKSVNLQKSQSEYSTDKIIFLLRCGVSVEIQDYSSSLVLKMTAAASEYQKLSGEQKLKGKIYALTTADGEVRANYNPNDSYTA